MLFLLTLKSFAKSSPTFLALIVVVYVLSTSGSLYLYSFYIDFNDGVISIRESVRTYSFNCTADGLDKKIDTYREKYDNMLQRLSVNYVIDNIMVKANCTYKQTKRFEVSSGHYLESIDEAVAPEDTTKNTIVGDNVTFGGKTYRVCGLSLFNNDFYEILYDGVPDKVDNVTVQIAPSSIITGKTEESFVEDIKGFFGVENVILPKKYVPDASFIGSIVLVLMLTTLGLMNIAYLYSILLEKLKKQQIVFFLLGCRKSSLFMLYIGVMTTISTALYIASCFVTKYGVFTLVKAFGSSVSDYLGFAEYLQVFFVMIVLLLILLSIYTVKYLVRTPYEIKQKN